MAKKTLKQLREQYPGIKARSYSSFMDKLKMAEGLGDTIEAITEATGIDKAVKWLANGKDCGCDERKKRLNEIFRYKPECMVESEYEWFTDFLTRYGKAVEAKGVINKQDIFELHRLYRRIFRVNLKICTNCPSAKDVISAAVSDLKKLYDEY